MQTIYQKNAAVFKALCDENRLRILEQLQGGETCACKLLDGLQIGQSTLSHHMGILCASGLVRARTEGRWTHYSLDPRGCGSARTLLAQLTRSREEV
ncbi:MAG: metalloregulator ArsR/SmtB family transcription factor [Pseudoflavonifractor sp.]